MMKGECNCGKVSFEILTVSQDVYICHCSICRRSTGSMGLAVLVVDNKLFQWSSGEDAISYWQKPQHDWHTSFCQCCGSPLPGANDESSMYVPASLITQGGESLRVTHQLWTESKANWYRLSDQGKLHPNGYQG